MNALQTLNDTKRIINDRIEQGFGVADMPELAEMIRAVHTVERYLEDNSEELEEVEEGSAAIQAADSGAYGDVLGHINDELSDSKMYYDLWVETSKPAFKEIARQELAHSELWVKIARETGAVSQTDLQNALTFHNAMLARLT